MYAIHAVGKREVQTDRRHHGLLLRRDGQVDHDHELCQRHTDASGSTTYFDGSKPIVVRELDNATPLMKYVWSPADGRMILRDAVAAVGFGHR